MRQPTEAQGSAGEAGGPPEGGTPSPIDAYRERNRELEQRNAAFAAALAATRADLVRAERSRAWRLGHGVTRLLRRLTGRRIQTEGALRRAIARIDQLEETTGLLPGTAARPERPALAPGSPQPIEPPRLPPPAWDSAEAEQLRMLRAELAADIRSRLGPVSERESWPAVSVIVVNRNGHDHLPWLVDGLADRTDYPQLELVVVDNGSTDGSLAFLDEQVAHRLDLKVVRNVHNASFSEANGAGAHHAGHDLLLLLNNDIELFEPGWLKELVVALEREGVGAVGATLLHPARDGEVEPVVQHRSIEFRVEDGLPRARNAGDGDYLFDDAFGLERRAPAVTAACLLVRRETFEAVGGLSDGYRYGTEDVDFGLKLAAGGLEIVASGRAVAFHRESSTQNVEGRDFKRVNRDFNRRLFHERWGPRLRREYRLARLDGDPGWTDGAGPHVAITVSSLDVGDGWGDWYTAHELGDALEARGWRVTYLARRHDHWLTLPHDLDHVISLIDVFDLRTVPDHITVSIWVRNWTDRWVEREWFDRADIILASSARSAEIIEQRTGRCSVLFPIATNPARFAPAGVDPKHASDYVFTGNWWGKERDIEPGLKPRSGEKLAIYGRGWEDVKALRKFSRGSAAYEDLPGIYSSAKLVLDDTQGPTLPYGAVNCRVFDALAAGTLVITNCELGVRELFDEDFPVWTSPETLRASLDELLSDDDRREELARRYRRTVLTEHTYERRADQFIRVVREHELQLSFCLKIGAPDAAQAERWGDLHFARAIVKQLRRRGHRCRIQTLDEWEALDGLTDDVVVHLKGLTRYRPKPGQFNVLWCISHPDELSPEECDSYDLVCVASARFAGQLAALTRTPVIVLDQATDPELFFPDFDADAAHELAYVANSRNVLRPIVRDLLPTDRDLAIWGANWDGLIDTRHVVGEHVENERLRRVYSSATIVLGDHWDDMREHGFVANRIYDALACGATVVCDDVAGLQEQFGDAVVTYSSPGDLRAAIDRLLADPVERMARAARGRDVVLERGTFERRVGELVDAVLRTRAAAGTRERVVAR